MGIAYALIANYNDNNNLKSEGRFTIGETSGVKSFSNSLYVNFEFNFNNKKYTGDKFYKNNIQKQGGMYFVKFYPKAPFVNKILINMPVPDSIKEAPPEGWSPEEFEKLFGKEK